MVIKELLKFLRNISKHGLNHSNKQVNFAALEIDLFWAVVMVGGSAFQVESIVCIQGTILRVNVTSEPAS